MLTPNQLPTNDLRFVFQESQRREEIARTGPGRGGTDAVAQGLTILNRMEVTHYRQKSINAVETCAAAKTAQFSRKLALRVGRLAAINDAAFSLNIQII